MKASVLMISLSTVAFGGGLSVAASAAWSGGRAAATPAARVAPELASPELAARLEVTAELDRFFTRSRVLVVFSESAELEHYRTICRSHRALLRERDMVVVEVVGAQVFLDGAPTWGNAAAFRRHFGVDPRGETMVLVGKDGGEKARVRDALPLTAVFRLVDSMPMRQREMRGRSSTERTL